MYLGGMNSRGSLHHTGGQYAGSQHMGRHAARGSSESGRERLIVGVDFGTTFSGVAAAHASAPDDIEIIKTWPGGSSDKVPTEIAYEAAAATADGGVPVPGPSIKWGFQVKADQARIRCIKLFLDRSLRLPFYVDNYDTAAQLQRCNKQVVDVVTDYLTQLHRHAAEMLARRYGEAFMAAALVEYVLTCPAVWSDAAKNTTLLAAERAGMGQHSDIQMISEPEAAAVYTLNAIQSNCLKVGDNIIVCDAGGGTVDLIAYKILSLGPLRVEESAVGTGGLCGSAFLNYGFEAQVQRKLGRDLLHEMKTTRRGESWQTALNFFETVKRSFNEEYEQEWLVPFPRLPADDEAGREAGCLSMTTSDMQAIFDPVVREVCDLVKGQVHRMRRSGGVVSGIVLVGGFGQSDYLYRRLKDRFGNAAPPPYSERPERGMRVDEGPIEVLQPIYAWTAVVRGAVLRGLQQGSMVVSRRARMHYGTSYATTYDENKHPPGQQYWSQMWEQWMIGDRMQWLVTKGQGLCPQSPIVFEYTRNFETGQSLVVTDQLFACEADEPPAARTADLVHVCTLTTDLSAVPRRLFTRQVSTQGVEFDNLDFSLEMTVGSARLGFELKVDGQRYGRVEADFH